jgi:muramidase (phage lysozyme)
MNANRRAFLDMIAASEGTSTIPGSDNGYNVIVGGSLFHDYTDHPRKLIVINSKLSSTAAGRYQLLAKYFNAYKMQLRLPDFGPDSQDAIALQLIRECKALEDVDAGRFDSAVSKCKTRWASLPGAGYGQHENKIETLRLAYEKAGGAFEKV